jgi:hypothetical protein
MRNEPPPGSVKTAFLMTIVRGWPSRVWAKRTSLWVGWPVVKICSS